jgi:hypothetical protein
MRLRLTLLTPGLRADEVFAFLRDVALDLRCRPVDFFLLARAMIASLLKQQISAGAAGEFRATST